LNAESKVDLKAVAAGRVAVFQDPTVDSRAVPLEGTQEQWRAQFEDGLRQPTLSLAQARTLADIVDELTLRGDPDAAAMKHRLTARLARIATSIAAKKGIDAAVAFTKDAYALVPESPELRQTLVDLLFAVAQRASTRREPTIASIKSTEPQSPGHTVK
jgi:hypothetical protein